MVVEVDLDCFRCGERRLYAMIDKLPTVAWCPTCEEMRLLPRGAEPEAKPAARAAR